MGILLHIAADLALLCMAYCCIMLVRNVFVYRFRMRLLSGDLDTYERITNLSGYEKMVQQFWRPLTVKEWLKG